VTHGTEPGQPFAVPAFDGERDGHPYHEEKAGKDNVCQSQEVFVALGMLHPVRNAPDGPEIIDEDHQQHGGGSENVNG